MSLGRFQKAQNNSCRLGALKALRKSQFFLPMTKVFIALSARLLERTKLPSERTVRKVLSYLRLYSKAVPSFDPGKTACLRHQSKNSSILRKQTSLIFSSMVSGQILSAIIQQAEALALQELTAS